VTPTPTVTPTVTPTTGSGCTATYQAGNSWPGGFQADVTVKNTGAAQITGWKVSWAWPGDQKVTQLWSGTPTQTGTGISVVNAPYNGTLAAGASTSFGFNGSYTGTNTSPATLTCSPV
jgi:cellulase/cellobiase CelA1